MRGPKLKGIIFLMLVEIWVVEFTVYAGWSSLPFWVHWKALVPARRLLEDIWRQLGHAWAAEGPLKLQLGAELDRLGEFLRS